VFIYDVTNKQSFIDIEKHYALVCDHCDKDAPLMLIGNKCDLDKDRVVEYNEGLELAKKLGNIPFYETSSKSGQSVDECFGVVVENAINYVEKKYSLEKPPAYEHLEIAEEGQQPTSWFHRLFWCCFSTDSDSHRIMS
jgi:GTPase SAR1 family protein